MLRRRRPSNGIPTSSMADIVPSRRSTLWLRGLRRMRILPTRRRLWVWCVTGLTLIAVALRAQSGAWREGLPIADMLVTLVLWLAIWLTILLRPSREGRRRLMLGGFALSLLVTLGAADKVSVTSGGYGNYVDLVRLPSLLLFFSFLNISLAAIYPIVFFGRPFASVASAGSFLGGLPEMIFPATFQVMPADYSSYGLMWTLNLVVDTLELPGILLYSFIRGDFLIRWAVGLSSPETSFILQEHALLLACNAAAYSVGTIVLSGTVRRLRNRAAVTRTSPR